MANMNEKIMGLVRSQVSLFLLMGAISTFVMFEIYVVLNRFMHYQLSYLIAYVVTVFLSYYLNSRFVFKSKMSWQTFLRFPVVYIVQYAGSALGLEILVRFGFSVTFAPILMIMLMIPITFLLSRFILVKK